MIEAFEEPGSVWSLLATPNAGAWKATASPGSLGNVTGGEMGKSVSLTLLPKCLPWVPVEDAKIGATLTASGHRKSNEALTVVGLQAGRYDVLENGQLVGTWDHIQLGKKVELQSDPESLTLQQAQRVIELNKKRNDEAIRPLRNLYGKRKGALRKGDKVAFDSWWNGAGKAEEAVLLKKAAEIEDEIYKVNQPAEIKIEVKPAAKLAPAKAQKPAKKQPN
jgi:hypothetical protein